MSKILLVDDEEQFRKSLARRLNLRGYETIDVGNGADAVKAARSAPDIDIVVLDRKMPEMSGEQTLKEIKAFRPEIQVIMLTGHGTMESAVESGKHDAFSYLQKPCEVEDLIKVVEEARVEKVRAMERHEIPHAVTGTWLEWLKGAHNSRPGFIILGAILFIAIVFTPAPPRLMEILSAPKTGNMTDLNLGYASYGKLKEGETIAGYYSKSSKLDKSAIGANGKTVARPLTDTEAAFRAQVMLGVLVVSVLFWATGAIPIGVTALFVGVGMYFFNVLQPDDIAQSYAKDAVIFIFGVLAFSKAISKTGLDRRIGVLLLQSSKSLPRFLYLFLPLLGVSCSFVSEHAMVAFLMPLFMMVYISTIREAGLQKDRSLAVMFVLALCFAANGGGPGSPAAGGRNAVMLGILSEYGGAPSFGEWVKYGLPFVPVMALAIAVYFHLWYRTKGQVKNLNISNLVVKASQKIGPMNRKEYVTAAALILLVFLWVSSSEKFGLGGPVILCILILNVMRILRWRDIAAIQWEVVALYASACALGKGLASTGAALFMADRFIYFLPEYMHAGEGLAIATSLFTGLTTNFMSDGATVSAIGPITVPMAIISGTPVWMVGFATSFASSFAHMFIIGTPNNAIAYALAKDPVTGEQLVTLGDFFKHGFVVLILSFAVLWGWTIFGYWRWIGF
ncbi:MAG: SLC13 family permease [Candidatus Omnitrophota bacterium]